jgi:hypothetical protein
MLYENHGDRDDDYNTNWRAAYEVSTNWYMVDTRDAYRGCDQVHNASGTCLDIHYIGHSTLYT